MFYDFTEDGIYKIVAVGRFIKSGRTGNKYRKVVLAREGKTTKPLNIWGLNAHKDILVKGKVVFIATDGKGSIKSIRTPSPMEKAELLRKLTS